MNELELLRLDLNNFIHGHEISKSACKEYWSKDDERALQLLYRIRDVLNRFETRKVEPSNCSEFPNNWIPCTPENLPNEDEDVLVTVRFLEQKSKKPNYYVDVARNYGGGWSSYSDEYKVHPKNHKVIAWQEMPEPYEPKEGE